MALRRQVRGAVLLPGDEGYDEARSVWNGDIDRRPAVIARCTGPDDVAAALRYAQEAGLQVAVRGGGHGYWGAAVPEGGLMIDLSPIHHVVVDRTPGGPESAGAPRSANWTRPPRSTGSRYRPGRSATPGSAGSPWAAASAG
jgi:hypothetical protein